MTPPPLDPILLRRSRIAVIGAGVSGLGAAWALRNAHDVTVFEKEDRLGGHANTAVIDYEGETIAVDTGFIVFNTLNYPNLTGLFDHLGLDSHRSDMSFGFSLDGAVEWCSNGVSGLFAQSRNLASPRFMGMLRDILRFNRQAQKDLAAGALEGLTLGDYLNLHKFGPRFRAHYLLPMGAAIWSSCESDMADYPAESFVRFFKNHRLMHRTRPKWRTVIGGSQVYVRRLEGDLRAAGAAFAPGAVEVRRAPGGAWVRDESGRSRFFDEVILACHSDQALALLSDPDPDERELLGAIRYAPNTAVLHRDPSLMPKRRRARAAWNAYRADAVGPAAVTYYMNRLQNIPDDKPLYVTLNPVREPDGALTFGRYEYRHPQFTARALAAQRIFNRIQGVRRTWFAGAWLGYGFHEDGLRAGLRVALRLGGSIPWAFADGDVTGGAWGVRKAHEHRAALAVPAE